MRVSFLQLTNQVAVTIEAKAKDQTTWWAVVYTSYLVAEYYSLLLIDHTKFSSQGIHHKSK